ncbi:MAG: hypothetical protein ACOYK8_00555 [Alphaproteobacteria bacterium]
MSATLSIPTQFETLDEVVDTARNICLLYDGSVKDILRELKSLYDRLPEPQKTSDELYYARTYVKEMVRNITDKGDVLIAPYSGITSNTKVGDIGAAVTYAQAIHYRDKLGLVDRLEKIFNRCSQQNVEAETLRYLAIPIEVASGTKFTPKF